jgi:hypothetical protein
MSTMMIPLRPPVPVETISPAEAHRFAAEQRIEALVHRRTAADLRLRAEARDRAADIADAAAVAWDAAARGDYPT